MRMLLLSFVVIAALIALTIFGSAAPEVTYAQRFILSAIPLVISILITWLAWKDA